MNFVDTVNEAGGVPINVFVHPIDKGRHPTWAGHYRWAVHLGENPHDVGACLQASVANTDSEGRRDGEFVALAVLNAFRIVGVPACWNGPTTLLSDPTPPEG